MENKLQEHLAHPFYLKARNFWEDVRQGQIRKGAEKYDEPFTPSSWSNDELVTHALQENVDQLHYIYGMKERMELQEKEIKYLKIIINELREELAEHEQVCRD